MKKLLIYSSIILTLGSIAFAESVDEQIQRLEKENKLLELKQRNQKLSSDLEAGKVTEDKTDKNTLKVKEAKTKDKDGFFLGVEAVLGSSDYTRQATIKSPVGSSISYSDSSATFDGGLLLGYQWYFGESQRHGLKLSAHLYSGGGYSNSNKVYISTSDYSVAADISHTLIPIKVGIDVKYLWDFLERGDHILGLNVGLGYEFDYYFGSIKTPNDKIASNFFNQGVYPTIGLHYNYKHHQFELNYRFGGILGMSSGHKSLSQELNDGSTEEFAKFGILTQSYIALNYAYRF